MYSVCILIYVSMYLWTYIISKNIFHWGGMAPSEWTRSIRAVRDTPVTEYATPGISTTRRVVYRPPIAVSPFRSVVFVSSFKQSLWRCGQLWLWVRIGSLGTRLHRDCNAMGDAVQISPRVPSAGVPNATLTWLIIHIIPSRQIYVAIDNPSVVPSVSGLNTHSYLWDYVRAANNVSHAENLQGNSCWCFSHLYKLKPAYPHPQSRSPRNHYISTPDASYRKESEAGAVDIATAGGVYTSINGLRQSQHPSILSLRHDGSCVCNGQTAGALYLEQTAVYECKRHGDSKLYNATCFESISWSPTLADNRDILEHCYAAKQHLVHNIWGVHRGDLERCMLKQRPTLKITCSNWYQVRAQVDKVTSDFIQSARDNIPEHYALQLFESAAERLEFIDSFLADNQYLSPVAEHGEDGVCSPNPTQRESKAANEWPASTSLPAGSNPTVNLHRILS